MLLLSGDGKTALAVGATPESNNVPLLEPIAVIVSKVTPSDVDVVVVDGGT